MYTAADRDDLYHKIKHFLQQSDHIEGLLQIGSSALGYHDIYSDIDLMAGTFGEIAVEHTRDLLRDFFCGLNADYIRERQWTPTVLGFSAFWDNGLSIDISFMPTEQLPIRSDQWRIAFSKTDHFRGTAERSAKQLADHPRIPAIDEDFHHAFLRELRYAEIALCRNDLIQADLTLTGARRQLLTLEVILEGKKHHEFKAYNTLDSIFLQKLEQTYPTTRTRDAYHTAYDSLLHLYLDTLTIHSVTHPSDGHLKMIKCFRA